MILRPRVGMQQYVALPYVVALGVCDALGTDVAGMAWPHAVVDARSRTELCQVEARAGYDEEGMFAEVGPDEFLLAPNVRAGVEARVASWAEQLAGKPRIAPLVPVLADYANALVQLGHEVGVTYPNGRPYAQGTFVGVDIWGRATVRLGDGSELEFPPEKYRLT